MLSPLSLPSGSSNPSLLSFLADQLMAENIRRYGQNGKPSHAWTIEDEYPGWVFAGRGKRPHRWIARWRQKRLKRVIDLLRTHYEDLHFRNLPRQLLSDCKQSPNELVHDFAERTKKLVNRVTQGQPKTAQYERLFDEFLDRLKFGRRFHVKSSNPASCEMRLSKQWLTRACWQMQ